MPPLEQLRQRQQLQLDLRLNDSLRHAGQVHYSGTGSNPLESPVARIAWDMRTLIDISNLDNIRAKVNYNHTCFPAHAILVNNFVIYNYVPERSDALYLANCLVLQIDKVVGEQSATV